MRIAELQQDNALTERVVQPQHKMSRSKVYRRDDLLTCIAKYAAGGQEDRDFNVLMATIQMLLEAGSPGLRVAKKYFALSRLAELRANSRGLPMRTSRAPLAQFLQFEWKLHSAANFPFLASRRQMSTCATHRQACFFVLMRDKATLDVMPTLSKSFQTSSAPSCFQKTCGLRVGLPTLPNLYSSHESVRVIPSRVELIRKLQSFTSMVFFPNPDCPVGFYCAYQLHHRPKSNPSRVPAYPNGLQPDRHHPCAAST